MLLVMEKSHFSQHNLFQPCCQALDCCLILSCLPRPRRAASLPKPSLRVLRAAPAVTINILLSFGSFIHKFVLAQKKYVLELMGVTICTSRCIF
jgi:hypothetical protein